MKKIYSLFIFLPVLLLAGCSKDFLKRYDDRIIGVWRITDINELGFGGNSDHLPFSSGTFTFKEDGSLEYTNVSGVLHKGRWDIVKKNTNENTTRSLQLTAVNFNSQQVLAEYYDDMTFLSTNHFKASIITNFHTYMTHFKR